MSESRDDARPEGPQKETAGQSDRTPQDSVAFTRCASCKHAAEVDHDAGTLLCKKHNMRCNAEIGAIPNDCLQYDSNELPPPE